MGRERAYSSRAEEAASGSGRGDQTARRTAGRRRTMSSSIFTDVPGGGGSGRGSGQRRLETWLFPVFYALCEREREKTSAEKMTGPLLWLPDVFQLLALCVQGDEWHPSAVRWIDVLGNFSNIILNAVGSGAFLSLFWLSIALVAAALADAVLVAILFRRRIYTTLWPVRALRLLTGTLVTAFFIPVLSFLVVGLQCAAGSADLASSLGAPLGSNCLSFPLILYNAVSTALLLPFLVFGLTTSLLYYNHTWASGDLVACAHGRLECLFTAARAALVLLAAVVPADSLWVPLALLFLLAPLSALYAIILPFYKFRVNALRAGLLSSTAFFALATLLLSALPDGIPDAARLAASLVLLALTGAAFLLGARLARWRHNRLAAVQHSPVVAAHAKASGVASFVRTASGSIVPPLNTGTASPAELGALRVSTRLFWLETDVEVAARFIHDRRTAGSDRQPSAEEEAAALERADGVYAEGARQFADGSAFVSLARILFLQALGAPEGDLAGEWRAFEALKRARFDHRFLAYQLRNEQAQAAHVAAAGRAGQRLNVVQLMEFQRDVQAAVRSHNEALKLLRSFFRWAAAQRYKDPDSAGRRLDAIDRARRRAAGLYEKLLHDFPASVPLLRHHALFLRDIENESEAADAVFAQADYIEEQNARAGGGEREGDGASGLGSTTDDSNSAGGSSVGGRRRGAAHAPRIKKNRAVRTLFFVIAACVVVLVAEPVVFFVVSRQLFALYDESITDLNNAGLRRKLFMDVMYFTRSAQMAAATNDTAGFASAAASLKKFAGDAQRIHEALYLKAGAFGWTQAVWRSPRWWAVRLVSAAGEAPTSIVEKVSALDLLEQALSAAFTIAAAPASQFAGDWSANYAPFRFIFDNGLFSVMGSLNAVVSAYEDEMYAAAWQRQGVLLALFALEIATIVALAAVALRPDALFRKIREASVGCGEVLARAPRRSMRRVYAVYKARDYVQESGDEGDEQALDTRRSDQPKPRPVAVAVAGREDASEDEEGGPSLVLAAREPAGAGKLKAEAGGKQRARRRRASRSSASSDGAPNGPKVLSLDEEEEGVELQSPAALALGDGSGSEGESGALRRLLGGPPSPDAVVSIAIPPAGARGSTPPSFGSSDGSPRADSGKGVLDAAVVHAFVPTPTHGQGPPGISSSLLPAAPSWTRDDSVRGGSAFNSRRLLSTGRPAAVFPAPASGSNLLNPTVLNPTVLEPAPGGSQHGQRRSISFSNFAEQVTIPPAAKPGPAPPAAPMDPPSAMDKAPVGGPNKRRGGILRRFFWRFFVAFTFVAAIALANFLTCFLAIQTGKYISSEIQSGGRRRYSSREVSFLARELALDDGALLPRDQLAFRLHTDLLFCRKVHDGLKFGDPDFRLPGSSLRYPPMEDLMFKPGCLLLNATFCGRSVEPTRVNLGYDTLVSYFLEQGQRVLQTFWYSKPDFKPAPDAFRANPCLDLLSIESCRYETSPSRLPESAQQEAGFAPRGSNGLRARAGVSYSGAELNAKSKPLAFVLEQTSPNVGDFFDGSQRAINLYFQEHMERLAAVASAQTAFLAAHLGLLLAICALLFRPMLLHLRRESGRLGQLLATIPPEVASDDKFFAPYFGGTGESEEEEEEEERGASR